MSVNHTFVLLGRNNDGRICVAKTLNPDNFARLSGGPVFGHYVRRLLTVNEIIKARGCSKNRAQALRKEHPECVLADLPGQKPLADALRESYLLASSAA